MAHALWGPLGALAVLFGLVGGSAADTGPPPFELSTVIKGINPSAHITLFADPEGKLTIDEVKDQGFASRFHSPPRWPVGVTSAAYWFRLKVHNPHDKPITWIMGPSEEVLDQFDLYVFHGDGRVTAKKINEFEPILEKEIDNRRNLFSAVTMPGQTDLVYARSRYVYGGPLSFALPFYTVKEFERFNNIENLLLGVFFGGLTVMFFYNLFLYFSIGDRIYLYYILYIASAIIGYTAFTGMGGHWIWSAYPVIKYFAPYSVSLAFLFLGIFSRCFLQTSERAPTTDKIILALIIACGIIAVLSVVNTLIATYDERGYFYQSWLNIPLNITVTLFVILPIVGVRLWLKGFTPARLFVLGWTTFLVAAFLRSGARLGLVYENYLINMAPLIGTWLEVIILSFALGDRINLLAREKKEAEERYTHALESAKEDLEIRVTERTAALVSAKERAEKATTLKDKFVSLVSHDLRSPIGSIKMISQLFEAKKEGVDSYEGYRRITTISDGLLSLIEKLLDVSRLQSGDIEPHKRLVDVGSLADEKISAIKSVAEQKGIVIQNHIPPEVRFFVDPVLYGEALGNLVTNAVKFCSTGHTITLSRPDKKDHLITVTDNGPGIDPAILRDLFKSEIKTSLPGSAGEKGTGLGLPYCREIMLAHGGDLAVISAPGEGATFTLSIPAVVTVVLIVDDQPAQRALMKEHLKTMGGIDCMEANNGAEALSLMSRSVPHLVISDISMPVMNGFDLIRAMRADPRLSDTPVVVATSNDGSSPIGGEEGEGVIDVRSRVFALGANDFVIKPVVPDDFIPRVSRFTQ